MRFLFSDFSFPHLLRESEYPVGGWAIQLKHLLHALKGLGHTAGVLSWKGAAAYAGPQSLCEVIDTYDPAQGIRKLRLLTYFLPSIVRAARSFRPDVMVQSCSGLHTGYLAFAAGRLRVPFVHRLASDMDSDGRNRLCLSRYERLAFQYGIRKADLIICQNRYQLSQIRERFPDKRAGLLYNAIDVAPGGVPRPRTARSYVAWVGVFTRPKNLGLLLRMSQCCPGIEFRVAGMPAPAMDAETAGWREQLLLRPNVRFMGYISRARMPRFLEGAAALLSTSDFEGFSNTFLEALAAGAPVVARAAVDPDSVIARNGLGFIARDESALAKCLEGAWNLSASEFLRLAERCRVFVAENHRPAAKAQELVEMTASLRGGVPTRALARSSLDGTRSVMGVP